MSESGEVLWQSTLTSSCPPRTKKNSSRMAKRGKRHIPLPSESYEQWEDGLQFDPPPPTAHLWQWSAWRRLSAKQRAAAKGSRPHPLVEPVPVNCRALIYRDANVGDAVGYYQAIGDALQAWGIIADDKWIEAWDGSLRLKDAARPRVEITLTRF